ncbi:MAG: type II secretion system F family protein [Puniceicoccales bacterium]|jgi:type II secretory pathway component PulF|nr:type II secretion system F family protein [Puniceicoccales bacterium]
MGVFYYEVLDRAKGKESGTLEANDKKQAVQLLIQKGWHVLVLKEKKFRVKRAQMKHPGVPALGRFWVNKQKIHFNFLYKFLQLHSGGLSPGDALKVMRTRLKSPAEQALAEAVHKQLCEGKTLATAMKLYPDIFPEGTVYMIEAGEKTGNLIPIIGNLIRFMEVQAEVKKRFIAGISYPLLVCSIAMAVVVLFIFYLLPRIQKMMTSMGGELPLLTRLLLGGAHFLQDWGLSILAIIGVGSLALLRFRQTAMGRVWTDRWLTYLPLLRGIVNGSYYCQTANLLATLLGSGINTTEAMQLAEQATSNRYHRLHFAEARRKVLDGVAITQAFDKHHVLPVEALDILSVGENTGDLASSFREIFKIHNGELSEKLHSLTVTVSSIALGFAFSLVAILAMSIVMSVMKFSATVVG